MRVSTRVRVRIPLDFAHMWILLKNYNLCLITPISLEMFLIICLVSDRALRVEPVFLWISGLC